LPATYLPSFSSSAVASFQVDAVEAFGEPRVERGEEVARAAAPLP
jgi:hypothetical protein